MDNKFKDVEALFNSIKLRFHKGEISRREFVDSLKQLRFKDEEGRFWMLGTQSGKWYCYQKNGWIQSSPPSIEEKKSICVYCGFENDLETAVCRRCGGRVAENEEESRPNVCPDCGTELRGDEGICPQCSLRKPSDSEIREFSFPGDAAREEARGDWLIRSVRPLSFLWLSGGLGLVIGVLTGLFLGATAFFPAAVEILPAFLKDMQGKLIGGILFAAVGGGMGFLAFGVFGFLTALLVNAILSFIGGLEIRIEKTTGKNGQDKP